MIAFDYSRLQGRIKEVCDTQNEFAKVIGMGRSTLNQKLRSKSYFSQDEINAACAALDIPLAHIPDYFFTPQVQKTEQRQ